MQKAIDEGIRRRTYQLEFNRQRNITPTTIDKPIREKMIDRVKDDDDLGYTTGRYGKKQRKETPSGKNMITIVGDKNRKTRYDIEHLSPDEHTQAQKKKIVTVLKKEMNKSAKEWDFERAARLRDVLAKFE
jgi:excinuclease ABC subunit B